MIRLDQSYEPTIQMKVVMILIIVVNKIYEAVHAYYDSDYSDYEND
jgi:hypothetical protein